MVHARHPSARGLRQENSAFQTIKVRPPGLTQKSVNKDVSPGPGDVAHGLVVSVQSSATQGDLQSNPQRRAGFVNWIIK